MSKAWAAGLVLAGLMTAATQVRAGDLEFFTGQMLAAHCGAKPTDTDYATHSLQCAAYVLGVSDAQQATQAGGGVQKVCLPATVNAPQIVDMVSAFLQAHPDKLPLAAQDLVLEALSQAYPCQ
jgi:hypothetical protein